MRSFFACALLELVLPGLALAKCPHSDKTSLVSAAWYPGWNAERSPPEALSWKKYTHMTFAFAETSPDVRNLSISGPEVLPSFVENAHKNGVKALVSVGGWTGSLYYSSAVATAANRTAFVKTITDLVKTYDLDGIDFDWEYPGTQGTGCNTISKNDTTNFLKFLQELRADPMGKSLTLTAATSILPWVGPDGEQLSDVSGFAKVLDWIAVMNYDIWGPWTPTTGPNAPLNDTCASSDNQIGSAIESIAAWSAAGMPKNQILLGVPGYGHAYHVNASSALKADGSLNMYAAYNASLTPGLEEGDVAGTDQCTGEPTAPSGEAGFKTLIEAGFLTSNGTVAANIYHAFDSCSQTPFVYNKTSEIFVAYDNAQSFAAKGQFIKNNKLRGFAMWEATGDYNDILLDSIHATIGSA